MWEGNSWEGVLKIRPNEPQCLWATITLKGAMQMPVVFPHADGYKITDADFRAAWAELIRRYAAGGAGTYLLRLPTIDSFSTLIHKKRQLSLEYLCRMLVPNGYRNTMQATVPFLKDNQHIVRPMSGLIKNPTTKRPVQGVCLVPAIAHAPTSSDIEALFEADIDDLQVMDMSSAASVLPPSPIAWGGYVDIFVEQINSQDHQPMYRGRGVNGVVTGWEKRLDSYFWPNPRIGLVATKARLGPILARSKVLAVPVLGKHTWTATEQAEAIAVANEIFKWGGVPQDPKTVTWGNVRKVFEAALTGIVSPGTLMNSGWTKVAAFATAHLGTGKSRASVQVIWDSRVSTSIIRRLDNIFHCAKLTSLPTGYDRIGLVAGRGGTRSKPLGLHFPWKSGYGSWDAQFIGSAFVQEVCECLNKKAMTPSYGSKSSWTIREVEMVLFGDGY